ncbi:MAG: Ppx/GppA phosphatase family protein [Rhodospirillales bacterium]
MKRGPAQKPRAQDQGSRLKYSDVRKSYAAIDLGTNSCRMLIAVPDEAGFHVVDGFSRVVRLGERVSETGRFQRSAMDRTMSALSHCADRMKARNVGMMRAVATEACRQAIDAQEFIERVQKQTGLDMEIISSTEEAALTVSGCGDLLRSGYDHALVFDIGGGSTEIIWVETLLGKPARLLDMVSLPFGVVSLRDEFGPESLPTDVFHGLLNRIDAALEPFDRRNNISDAIAENSVRMVGTSGTVTTLGAMYLELPRYKRNRVDGLEIRYDSIRQIGARLAEMSCEERIRHPCLGHGRGDLMLMGLAVLRAVCERWQAGKLRVADRGIREGILAELMAADGHDKFGLRLQRADHLISQSRQV